MDRDSVPVLCQLAAGERAFECAFALGLLADERAEAVLCQLLRHSSIAVSDRAAEALGKCGSSRSVAPLLELAHATKGVVKQTAQASVRAIQERLEGAGAGQISLATPVDEGALSLSEGEQGALSVPGKRENE